MKVSVAKSRFYVISSNLKFHYLGNFIKSLATGLLGTWVIVAPLSGRATLSNLKCLLNTFV